MTSNTRPPSKTPSYLQPTASTAQRAASSALSKRTRTTTRHNTAQSHAQLRCNPTSGSNLSCPGEPKSSVPKSQEVETRARTAQIAHPSSIEDHPKPTEPPQDSLQVAAQVQPWLFMQSNLQRSLSFVQKGAQDSHCALAEVSSNPGDGTTRSEAETLLVFLDDLANAASGGDLASFVHKFLEHDKSWFKLQSELTQFFARLSQAPTDSPLEEEEEQNLNLKARLANESMEIASLLAEIESWNDETKSAHHAMAQLDPILRARSENILIASDAIDCSLDNIQTMRRLRA